MGAQWRESIARGQLPRAWREGATWSCSEPKVGNFRNFAPPIQVACPHLGLGGSGSGSCRLSVSHGARLAPRPLSCRRGGSFSPLPFMPAVCTTPALSSLCSLLHLSTPGSGSGSGSGSGHCKRQHRQQQQRQQHQRQLQAQCFPWRTPCPSQCFPPHCAPTPPSRILLVSVPSRP